MSSKPKKTNDEVKPQDKKEYKVPKPKPNKNSTNDNQNENHSEIMTLKRRVAELEAENKNQKSLIDKLDKKSKSQIDEVKRNQKLNESQKSEITALQRALQKITNEKNTLEKTLEEKNKYIDKIEAKLLKGANNQFLIELNAKNKTNMENFETTLTKLKEENEMLLKKNQKMEQEIKILNQAVDYKMDDYVQKATEKMNNNNNNNKKGKTNNNETNINTNTMKKEFLNHCRDKSEEELIRKNSEKTLKENSKLKDQIKQYEVKIQELEFTQKHLTEMLVEKDNIASSNDMERESYENHIKQITNERDILRDCLQKIQEEQKIIETDVETESKKYQNKITALQNINADLTQKNTEFETNLAMLEKSLSLIKEKYEKLESNYKKKVEDYAEIQAQNEINMNKIQEYEKQIENLHLNNEGLMLKFNDMNETLHKIENENFDLLSKVKKNQIEKENSLNEIVKQNLSLTQSESRLKTQIEKLNEEIEKLKKEREMYKTMSQEYNEKSNTLLREKNQLAEENNNQVIQIEKLKNDNMFLQRGLNNTFNYTVPDKSVCSDILNTKSDKERKELFSTERSGFNKGESILDMVRKEKEKSKDVLNEIKKIQKNKKDVINLTYN